MHVSQCPEAAFHGNLPGMSILDKPLRARTRKPQVELGPPSSEAPRRDGANELYDRACDLLLAAEGVRAAAAAPGSAAAIAASLGCIESSLEALAHAVAAMRREADQQLSARTGELAESGVSRDAARAGFSALVDALGDAHRAADDLRERTGPLLARLTLV
jgi:hypothetical protein